MSEKPFTLQRTMTLSHEPVVPPNYYFTEAEVFAMADAEDKAKADAVRLAALKALKHAEADFDMANSEVLRAHKMNGPNVDLHVQSALCYREDSRRRLAAAEQAYSLQRAYDLREDDA